MEESASTISCFNSPSYFHPFVSRQSSNSFDIHNYFLSILGVLNQLNFLKESYLIRYGSRLFFLLDLCFLALVLMMIINLSITVEFVTCSNNLRLKLMLSRVFLREWYKQRQIANQIETTVIPELLFSSCRLCFFYGVF